MKILIAPDKFKGSLSALQVCQAIGRGLKKCNPSFDIRFHPMADGGDGSLEVLNNHLDLKIQEIETLDPLNNPIKTNYFISNDAAFIEIASASGLVLLSKKDRNPLNTSTFGTGLIIKDAISKGCQQIFLFLGGSATNDAGIGIAAALGYQFLDDSGNILQPIGSNLSNITSIGGAPFFEKRNVQFTLLCDVTNPLFGPNGAAHVYAPQKGADEKEVVQLDNGLRHFSNLLTKLEGIDISLEPGSGAAGGIGASLLGLFESELKKGFETIAQLTGLEDKVKRVDHIISGEGKLDAQSMQGKVIDGLSSLCEKYQKPLTLFVGKSEFSGLEWKKLWVNEIYAISDWAKDLEDAMTNGKEYLERLSVDLCRRLL